MLRFTIRDVLWLTVVAALATGWWLHYREAAAIRASYIDHMQLFTSMVEQLDSKGIGVYDDPARPGVVVIGLKPRRVPSSQPLGPPTAINGP